MLTIIKTKWISCYFFSFLLHPFVKHVVALPTNSVKFYPCNDKLSETGFKLNH
jgi:hypothetical protein